jgi:hypothetical protein
MGRIKIGLLKRKSQDVGSVLANVREHKQRATMNPKSVDAWQNLTVIHEFLRLKLTLGAHSQLKLLIRCGLLENSA